MSFVFGFRDEGEAFVVIHLYLENVMKDLL